MFAHGFWKTDRTKVAFIKLQQMGLTSSASFVIKPIKEEVTRLIVSPVYSPNDFCIELKTLALHSYSAPHIAKSWCMNELQNENEKGRH